MRPLAAVTFLLGALLLGCATTKEPGQRATGPLEPDLPTTTTRAPPPDQDADPPVAVAEETSPQGTTEPATPRHPVQAPAPVGGGVVGAAVSGTVERADGSLLVLRDRSGSEYELAIDDQARAWVDGVQVGPRVLHKAFEPGDEVRASFIRVGETNFLREVRMIHEKSR